MSFPCHDTPRTRYATPVVIALTLIFFGLVTWLTVGDYAVRLANTICDDNPVVFAHFLNHPEKFHGDILETYGRVYGLGSVQNWATALLLRYFGTPPEIPTYFFILLQNILFPLSIAFLTARATTSVPMRFIAPLFAYTAEVWQWNLTDYRSILHTAYPGHLVLPFLVFASGALLEESYVLMGLCLGAAALVHPGLTLQMGFIAAIALALRFQQRGWVGARLAFVTLMAPLLLCVAIPVLILPPHSTDTLSYAQIAGYVSSNGHLSPWLSPRFWTRLVPTIVAMIALVVLALKSRTPISEPYRLLVKATLLGTLMLGVAHLVAAGVGWVPILQLGPLRATSVMAVLVSPLIASFLMEAILEPRNILGAWMAGAVLFFHALFCYGLYWPLLGAQFVLERSRRNRLAWSVFLLPLALVMLSALMAWHSGDKGLAQQVRASVFPGAYLDPQSFGGLLLLSGALALMVFRTGRGWHPLRIQIAVIVGLSTLCLVKARRVGLETKGAEARANFDTQAWARDHTPERAVFVVAESIPWRSISQRKITGMGGGIVYSRSRTAKEVSDRVARILSQHQVQTVADLSDEGVRQLLAQFPADYLVRRKEHPLHFPVAYQNKVFVIYEVSGGGRHELAGNRH